MRPVSQISYLKVLAVVGLVVLGGAALPAAAEAQARGTLQASATVVDTKQGDSLTHCGALRQTGTVSYLPRPGSLPE